MKIGGNMNIEKNEVFLTDTMSQLIGDEMAAGMTEEEALNEILNTELGTQSNDDLTDLLNYTYSLLETDVQDTEN